MENNFDLKKFLIENKLTPSSQNLKEENSPTVDSNDLEKIKQSSEVRKLAAAVAKDSKAVAKLDQLMAKAGVSLNEDNGVDIDSSDIQKIASLIAPSLKEEKIGGGDRMMAGFWGGAGAMFIPGALEAVNSVLGMAPYNPAGGIAAMAAGTLLAAIYNLIKGDK
jgi:hypothetical protein